jgi:hypothetical protein
MAIAPRTDNPAKDMAAIMAQARNYPDSRLADVLAGKDMSIPQYVAMAEAMGRRNLRQAVDGAQAQQQAQQPSVKEQLLAEQSAPQMVAGIDQLPAANMESMDLAGGGIIAFGDGGDVPGFYEGELIDGFGTNPEAAFMDQMRIDEIKRKKDIQQYNFLKDASPVAAARMLEKNPSLESNPAVVAPNAAPAAPPAPPAPPAAPPAAPNPAIDVSQPTKFERRASPFGEMSAEKVDVEGLKSRGLGEGLMRLGAGFLSAPGAKGISAGIAGLAEQAGLTRKETNALKKDARDYDLNRTRAEAAFEQGQDELGLKYTEAANLNKYRMDSLAKEPDALRTARAALKDPKLAALIGKEGKAELYSVEAATKAFNDILKDNRSYAKELAALGVRDPLSYRQFVITGLPPMQVVDTIPGKGDKVRS